MEEKKYPIIIKKKNSFMVMAVVAEFLVALVYGITQGFASVLFAFFLFVAIVTALALWVEYSSIATLAVEEGNEDKNKKKEYVTISYRETSNKKNADKNAKIKKYYISPSYYCANDFKMIKEVIKSKNPEVKFNENLSKYIKE